MPNATDRNQNARQTAQDEAEAIRGLAKHNQDYRRLPKALQAIVDAYNDLDDADENMAEAQTAASHPDMARQDPNDDMLHELAGLVAHVRAELRRHGVIEGALAWLASHPEGWDDGPEDTALYESSTQVPERYLVLPGMPSYCRHGVDLADECAACQADAEMMAGD